MITSAFVQARRRDLTAAVQPSNGRPSVTFRRWWMPHPVAHILHSLGHLLMNAGRRLDGYALDPWCHDPKQEWASEGSAM
jgi:hypothetical protein